MKQFQFEMATRLHFGTGALSRLREEAEMLDIKHWLLVVDSGLDKLGYTDRIREIIAPGGNRLAVYPGVDSEPTDRHVHEGVDLFRKASCRAVIALGGGSAIDAGKAIAVMAANKGHISDYQGFDKIKVPKAPLIAIPTTAGTGSEVTRAAGITDTRTQLKMVIIASTVAPNVGIDDPELTIGLPRDLTAQTGMDALSHAIEAFVSQRGNPISDSLALESMKVIGTNLLRAWQNGADSDARSQMMLGQCVAGMAVMNAQVCLVHGMSRPLGVYFHIPHGMANAMLLPLVMRYNVERMENPGRYARMAEAWGNVPGAHDGKAKARHAVAYVERLGSELEIPKLKDLEVDKQRYDSLVSRMAEDCLASGSPANNPVHPSREDVMDLYRMLWEA
jgi:alcohol dehydrogenase